MMEQLLFVKYYCLKTHKCLLEILSKTSDAFCPGALGSTSLSYWVECIVLAQHHKYQDIFVAPQIQLVILVFADDVLILKNH